ncbi:MAG: oxygen-independent coproporphyrinogen III oxidase [Alphaproteobacteria bacterium]
MKTNNDIEKLLGKYNRPVPRYTSFPTAVQFTHDISQNDYVSLIEGIEPDERVSVYIHIPFCHSLCHYCGCNTKILNSYAPVESYLENMFSEISLVGKTMSQRQDVSLVHFGGGSPNYLKPKDLRRVIDKVSEFFDISDDTNIDIESDPRYLDTEMIKCYADIGVTRVSLGVQDFNHDVQVAINRVQPFEMVENCVKELRENGINQINFDLIIGLPKQTVETVRNTAESAASLLPDRLAVFPYAHVPWMKKHQKLLDKYVMADGYERFLMNEAVDSVLKGNGYNAIGTDHYARAVDPLCAAQSGGELKRNFQGYTTDSSNTIIGFGLSSISSYKDAYVQNTTDPASYRKNLSDNKFPIQRGCVLSDDDRLLRSLIEEVMCNFKVDLTKYADVLAGSIDSIKIKLSELEQDGLVVFEGQLLKITQAGLPFTRVVASCFDPYFQMQDNQHAKAI